MIENPPSPLPWNLIVKPQIFIKKAHFLIKLWVNTEIWYFLTSEGLQWGFLWSAPWIFELLQGFWNKMWKFIRPFMKWLFSMKTPKREGWLLAHFTPKPWEQLQNPGRNFKTLRAIPKPWEQPPLPRLESSLQIWKSPMKCRVSLVPLMGCLSIYLILYSVSSLSWTMYSCEPYPSNFPCCKGRLRQTVPPLNILRPLTKPNLAKDFA